MVFAISEARGVGVEIHVVEIHDPERYGALLAATMKTQPGALIQLSSPLVAHPRYSKPLADLALKHRLPAISLFKQFAEAGGLMTYGPELAHFYARLAVYVDKILKGAKAA